MGRKSRIASPSLDDPCGRTFRYRDFVECGETWTSYFRTGAPLDNLPRQPATWDGFRALAEGLLDPLADALGVPVLTYAFAGPALARKISGRIAPAIDQHAGSELRSDGRPICERLGQAVDLYVPGVSSGVVARWIAAHTRFDRLYFYGVDRPVHASVGPDATRQVVCMRRGPSGRLVPRVINPDEIPSHTTGNPADPSGYPRSDAVQAVSRNRMP
jgi:hypothetical protein